MRDRRRAFRFVRRLGAWGLVGAGLAGACSDDSTREKLVAAQIGDGCLINSDCTAPLKCAFRRCHTECETTRDCPLGQRCVASDRPFHVCQFEDEAKCSNNASCPSPMVCGVDGECRDQCKTSYDCIGGQVCASGACADTEELVDGGLPPAEGGGAGGGSSGGVPCAYTSECPVPYVCRASVCQLECLGDRDCAAGQRCVGNLCVGAAAGGAAGSSGSGGAGAGGSSGGGSGGGGSGGGGASGAGGAAADASAGCVHHSDCASFGAGYRCLAGSCAPECKLSIDCASGASCVGGRCVVDAPDGAPDGFGSGCQLSSDCPPGLICLPGGTCGYQCRTNVDCAPGQCCSGIGTCLSGAACLPDGGPPPPDSGAADAPLGPACSGDLDCQDTDLCDGHELCVQGHCRPPLKATCDDSNPCTLDQCAPATGACSFVQIGPQDSDQDGHYDASCGGGADDCDDTNPYVHAGHAERCDQVDNNCDGRVDEGVWNAEVPKTLVGSGHAGGAAYSIQLGPPAITRLADGTFVVVAAGGGTSLHAWRLGADLEILEGPLDLLTNAAPYPILTTHPVAASGGGSLVVSGLRVTQNSCTIGARPTLGTGTSLAALGVQEAIAASAVACTGWHGALPAVVPSLAWNGSVFLAAWADSRDGVLRAYVSTLTTGGALGGTKTPLVDPAEVTLAYPGVANGGAYIAAGFRVAIAAGPSSSLVAYPRVPASTSSTRSRHVVLDPNLGAVLAGPVDVESATHEYPLAATYSGGSFFVVTEEWGVAGPRLHRVHPLTGAVTATTRVPSTVPWQDPRVAPMPGGVLVTYAKGTSVSFAWVQEAFAADTIAPRDVYSGGTTVSSPTAVGVDAKAAVMAWQDDGVKVVRLVCGP